MNSEPEKLLLWDIDGTIIATQGAGEAAMDLAMLEVFGINGRLNDIDYSGRTDPLLGRMICRHYGISETEAKIKEFVDLYVRNLASILAKTPATLLPGMDVLETLASRQDVLQGLLTGNVRAGGKCKLSSVGVWQHFAFGSFADNCFDRNDLGPKALKLASQQFGVEFAPDQVFVIGDTPRDIECGQLISAATVGVATGKYSVADLQEAGADFVFEDLSDTSAFLAIF
jgi:phosphoglycolate phosphatase